MDDGKERMITYGTCPFCGQVHIVSDSYTQDEANGKAAEKCDCDGAVRGRRRQERIERAAAGVERIFGSGAADCGQRPVGGEVLDFLKRTTELMAGKTFAGDIVDAVTVDIAGVCRAKFSVTSKGNIKMSRSETRVRSLES